MKSAPQAPHRAPTDSEGPIVPRVSPAEPVASPAKPRTHKASTKAAAIFDRLNALDEAEAAELANAPTSIRDRYREKRASIYEGLSGEVHELVRRFRGPGAAEFKEDEGPVSE